MTVAAPGLSFIRTVQTHKRFQRVYLRIIACCVSNDPARGSLYNPSRVPIIVFIIYPPPMLNKSRRAQLAVMRGLRVHAAGTTRHDPIHIAGKGLQDREAPLRMMRPRVIFAMARVCSVDHDW